MPNKPPPGSVPGQAPPDIGSMMEAGMMQQAQAQHTNVPVVPEPSEAGQPQQTSFQHQQQPRDVGTLGEETKMMASDVVEGLKNLPFDIIRDILGLKREPKTPEELAQLQSFHQNYQNLDEQQQQVARQRLQAEAERKQLEEEEKLARKRQEEEAKKQADQQNFIPQGKVSGQAALDKMQQDRKGMGGASG